jgi:hypothetical protein
VPGDVLVRLANIDQLSILAVDQQGCLRRRDSARASRPTHRKRQQHRAADDGNGHHKNVLLYEFQSRLQKPTL